jgi:hypothetical protein
MMDKTADSFFPLDVVLRCPDGPDPQEVAERTGLTIIVDEDAATVGADCWQATLLAPDAAARAYAESGGTVSRIYAPGLGEHREHAIHTEGTTSNDDKGTSLQGLADLGYTPEEVAELKRIYDGGPQTLTLAGTTGGSCVKNT